MYSHLPKSIQLYSVREQAERRTQPAGQRQCLAAAASKESNQGVQKKDSGRGGLQGASSWVLLQLCTAGAWRRSGRLLGLLRLGDGGPGRCRGGCRRGRARQERLQQRLQDDAQQDGQKDYHEEEGDRLRGERHAVGGCDDVRDRLWLQELQQTWVFARVRWTSPLAATLLRPAPYQ